MNKDAFYYRLITILAFLSIYFIWGTTFLAIVIGLKGFPPFLMAALRFIIAGVILIGYSLYRKESLPSAPSLLKNAIIGVIVMAGGQGLLIWGEQYIASGYAAVLIATLPIWFVVLDRTHWKTYFSNYYLLTGIAVGFIGIVVLFRDKIINPIPGHDVKMQLIASLVVIFGGICWVVGTLFNRSRPASGTLHSNLGWQLVGGSLFCLFISFLLGEYSTHDFSILTWQNWSAVLYLSVAGSVVAFVAYSWLLKEYPSAIVGTYAYINPIVAVFLGWLFAGEVITFQQMMGMSIVIGSAVLINLSRNKIQLSNK